MAHVILGLLMLWPQSLYELTKNFEAGVSLFYSASTGSIKRALDHLLDAGHISVQSEEGPRGKRVYTITNSGRVEFRRWMLDPEFGGDSETAILARTYFLGLLPPEDRPAVSAHVRDRIRRDLGTLEHLEQRVAAGDVPAGFEDIATYQRATLEYGLIVGRAAREWAGDVHSHEAGDGEESAVERVEKDGAITER